MHFFSFARQILLITGKYVFFSFSERLQESHTVYNGEMTIEFVILRSFSNFNFHGFIYSLSSSCSYIPHILVCILILFTFFFFFFGYFVVEMETAEFVLGKKWVAQNIQSAPYSMIVKSSIHVWVEREEEKWN